MLDIFIPFGAFTIFMMGIVILIAIAVTFYNVMTWLFNKDDDRFD